MQPIIEGKPLLGATYLGEERTRFLVWAPFRQQVEVHLVAPEERIVAMDAVGGGYFRAVIDGVEPGAKYLYRLDGDVERPDPASRLQPESVHGPSAVVARDMDWESPPFGGLPLRDYVIYELHVGTFTEEGTFDAAIEKLDHLVQLGVTAVEVMPVAEFPGHRNWGYDGVHPFAVETSYGGPQSLKSFIRACHERDLAVVLDVVYNHLGPEGNYLHDYGPYFTDKYQTPWGMAVNFDGDGSDEVRRYFLQNAAQWIDEFHVDALRLDAVHAIYDDTPLTFLEELRIMVAERERRHNRRIHLIAETHANDPRLVASPERGGIGMDSHWSDDFHHAVHTLITGEEQDYYCDYGSLEHLTRCLRDGYSYTGQHSKFRGRRHGLPPRGIRGERFVVCVQNHDQVGNRPQGRRLSELASFEQQKLAACALLCSPFVPLLFMGEEYGELARFPYFISHGDPDLVEAVREGRRAEFPSLTAGEEPPDPASEETFRSAKLDWSRPHQTPHSRLLALYRELIRLRKNLEPLRQLRREQSEVSSFADARALAIRRWYAGGEALILLNFGEDRATVELELPSATWQKRLETCSEHWNGPGERLPKRLTSESDELTRLEMAGHSAALYDALPVVED
ncbi:malto-oligosyltrehalose trehalohydrolase [Persicimonas caeni]|uniref:Malto-oligosyltrehalose trehalohydrolase n=1 Tax=Persicimonas caeni TaxID=2292766 RepID=A0A4Y6Q2A6_PERCE|nr:malto-oligosyltrehalose trehalohydrolase [Persicimonas caeni]QDG54696.1 malto-oligosyltrehalose trehalohydrolase [Persicimonas caeni]QED35917.1 malto-oligosyltrehalose trehalohydrolase [Persicimonas caeni]